MISDTVFFLGGGGGGGGREYLGAGSYAGNGARLCVLLSCYKY